MPQAPAGWYSVGDSERYWDGVAWTRHVQAPSIPWMADLTVWSTMRTAFRTPPSPCPRPHPSLPPPSTPQWPPPSGYPADHPRAGFGYVQSPYPLVSPKSPGLSLLASFFVPGLGSMINGEVGKGAGILIGYFISCLLAIILIGIPGVIGFWVWGMVDAYQGARLWNTRRGPIG